MGRQTFILLKYLTMEEENKGKTEEQEAEDEVKKMGDGTIIAPIEIIIPVMDDDEEEEEEEEEKTKSKKSRQNQKSNIIFGRSNEAHHARGDEEKEASQGCTHQKTGNGAKGKKSGSIWS